RGRAKQARGPVRRRPAPGPVRLPRPADHGTGLAMEIPFGPVVLDSVSVFFTRLPPPERASLHTRSLAGIARLVRHPGSLDRTCGVTDPAARFGEPERVKDRKS